MESYASFSIPEVVGKKILSIYGGLLAERKKNGGKLETYMSLCMEGIG